MLDNSRHNFFSSRDPPIAFGDRVIYALPRQFEPRGTFTELGMTTSTLDEKGVSMTAGPRRGLKLSQIKAQGTALGAVDLPEEFRTWALANNFPTAEAVYGFFYAKSDEKDRLLKSLGMNYNRLFDRLCKAIPSDKLAQLNRLAGEEYQIGEM